MPGKVGPTLLVDPSMVISARGRQWVERAERDHAHVLTYPSSLSDLSYNDYRNLLPMSWAYYTGLGQGGEWLDVRKMKSSFAPSPEGLSFGQYEAVDLGALRRLVGETKALLEGGSLTLIARRPEIIDLMVQAAWPITHVGQSVWAERLRDHVSPALTPELMESMGRRVRYLLWFELPRDGKGGRLILADKGKGATR